MRRPPVLQSISAHVVGRTGDIALHDLADLFFQRH
jgi:hypothetical protein